MTGLPSRSPALRADDTDDVTPIVEVTALPPALQRAIPFQHPGVQRCEDGGRKLPSPLRYPGAKRQLIPLFTDLLIAQPRRVSTFVEPFAGGASVALHLAVTGLVDRVVIAERDPLLYAFWYTAAFDTAWLQQAVTEVEVSVAQWERFKAFPGRTRREKALACLYLNRTSFSGILYRRAGPIGGREQRGKYKIGCRFNPEALARAPSKWRDVRFIGMPVARSIENLPARGVDDRPGDRTGLI
jgi:D12 class N6 adenine-specific DNA methyltransferase